MVVGRISTFEWSHWPDSNRDYDRLSLRSTSFYRLPFLAATETVSIQCGILRLDGEDDIDKGECHITGGTVCQRPLAKPLRSACVAYDPDLARILCCKLNAALRAAYTMMIRLLEHCTQYGTMVGMHDGLYVIGSCTREISKYGFTALWVRQYIQEVKRLVNHVYMNNDMK